MLKKLAFSAKIATLAVILTLTTFPIANAQYFNLGSLDVKPIQTEQSTNPQWIIEYLKPGEKLQKQIQISNFSPLPKTLKLYTTETSLIEENKYFTKSPEETSENLNKWIKLPTEEITLKGGESIIISANIDLPTNAGVGLHTGAIMVREIKTDTTSPLQSFAIEKGVRVYLNVTGPIISSGNLQKVTATQSADIYELNIQTINTGTVDYKEPYELKLKDISNNIVRQTSLETNTKPGESATNTISVIKPNFGIYKAYISNTNGKESLVQTVIFIPFWTLMAALMLALALALILKKQPQIKEFKADQYLHSLSYDLAYKLNWQHFSETLKNIFKSPELQRSAAYLCLLAITATATFSYLEIDPGYIQSQTLESSSSCTYDLTVKWGNLRFPSSRISTKNDWQGSLYFPNAKVTIKEFLHFERDDKAEIMGDNTALNFETHTGPDNDGIVLRVEGLTNEKTIIVYEDFKTEESVEFLITDYMQSAGVYPDGLLATTFQSDICEEEKLRLRTLELAALGDLVATPELLATAEIAATPTVGSHIPELENLFIEELPATPEALSDFIFRSDYVEKITRQDSTRKIATDEILLKALEATPDILEEIAASPDLNFIFIPTKTVSFPPLEFSFTEEKVVRQELGTLIFVQNKETAWNTFVGTTDFQLLSGDLRIPASSLTIDPGTPIILGQYIINEDGEYELETPGNPSNKLGNSQKTPAINKNPNLTSPEKITITDETLTIPPDIKDKIQAGAKRKFIGKFDKTTLVNVNPTPGKKIIFVLRPMLEIRIPAGMPAGSYLGELTITSL